MCNSSAEAIDVEIIDELRHGKNVEPNGKYDGINVQLNKLNLNCII